jgi:hypothetical protein
MAKAILVICMNSYNNMYKEQTYKLLLVGNFIYLNITNALGIRSSNENKITWYLIILMEQHYISNMYLLSLDLQNERKFKYLKKIVISYASLENRDLISILWITKKTTGMVQPPA